MSIMNDFTKTNKTSSVYWLKEPLENIKIRLKIKAQESIILLPKFDDYSNAPDTKNLRNGNTTKEFIFKWQEKVFSLYEIRKYSDVHNCISERDWNLHNRIKQIDAVPQKVFTYLNEDCFMPMPLINKKSYNSGILNLNSCLERLNLEGKVGAEANSTRNLFSNDENVMEDVEWTAMHIVYDNSQYDEDDNRIYSDECLLLSLYHHSGHNYMMVSPDVNNSSNTYAIDSASGHLDLEYYVEINFGMEGCSEELIDLLNKLYKKWLKKQKYYLPFIMPPLGSRTVAVSLQIAYAKDFEMDNLYVEYHIKIPDNIQCKSNLYGRTHITKSLAADDTPVWMLGNIVDLELDIATGIDAQTIKILFEVISLDWWGRHRTEGYTRLSLSLQPGRYVEQLSCSRPEEMNEIDAESRRFFVGGCHLIEDLDVLEKPQLYTANFRNVTSGSLSVHWSVLSQSHSAGHPSPTPIASGSALLQGADAVLKEYKKAKATLVAATRNFRESGDL